MVNKTEFIFLQFMMFVLFENVLDVIVKISLTCNQVGVI